MKKRIPPSSEPFDYEAAKQKVKEQFRTGKSLYGKDGAFAPLLQDMFNSILEGEIEGHLDEEERDGGNRKNGKNKKSLKTSSGNIEVSTPRDRLGSFEPEIVKKRETIMAKRWRTRSSAFMVWEPVCGISAPTLKRPTIRTSPPLR